MQKPANPCKPAGAGEAQKRREGLSPTYVAREAEGQTPGDLKIPKGTRSRVSCASCRSRRKSTAPGRKPSDASKTPPTQQQVSTAGVDQQTVARKVVEPAKGKQRKGKLCWHKVENQVVYQDTTNPTINVHCRSRAANRSQIGAEHEKGNQLQDTLRKTAGAPGKAQQPHQKRLNKSLPYTQQEERKKTQLRRHRKKPHTHTHRDHQRWGPAAKTHKASYCRIEISGELTDGAKMATP